MYREIKKKKLILENRKPFSREAEGLIADLNKLQWAYSSLALDGCNLSKVVVEGLLNGEFFEGISIGDHLKVSNYGNAINLVYKMASEGAGPDKARLLKILELLSGSSDVLYRQSNPVLRMIDYNPPHFKDVEKLMDLLLQKYKEEKTEKNPVMVAASLHNRIIEIYPYEENSEAMARMAANFHLMSEKLPPAAWNMSEQEYYDAIAAYLKNEDIGPIYNMLERSVFNNMEVMLQLTAGR